MRILDANRIMKQVAGIYFPEIGRNGSYDFSMDAVFVPELPGGATTLMRCEYLEPRPSFKDYDEEFTVYMLDILSPRTVRNLRIVIGGLGHELSHLIAFGRGMRKPHNERAIDRMAIERGLGPYLLDMKYFLREWNPNFKFRSYTPEQVRGRIS